MKKIVSLLGVAVAIGFSSCSDIDSFIMEDYQGAFILNEGTDKSNVSYYSYEHKAVTNNYFQTKNSGAGMSSGAHAMAIRRSSKYPKGKAFIVYPEANEISMINLDGFASVGKMTFTHPRDIMAVKEDVAYVCAVSAEGKGMVYEHNSETDKNIKSFEVAKEPLKMISSGKYLYCACKGDGTGAKLMVIDMSNGIKADTVDLAYDNPIDMVVDIDRNVWVYCAGNEKALVKITRFEAITLDGGKATQRDTIVMGNRPTNFLLGRMQGDSAHPLTVSEDGRTLFYVYNGNLCQSSVYAEGELSKNSIVAGDGAQEVFNSIDFDPHTNRIMALTDGKLVVLKYSGETWSNAEVYSIGVNPLMTTFNY